MTQDDPDWSRLSALVVSFSDTINEPTDIKPDSNLFDDLGLSSLMAVNLIMELESTFDIIIKNDDFTDIQTVADLQRIVEKKRLATAG